MATSWRLHSSRSKEGPDSEPEKGEGQRRGRRPVPPLQRQVDDRAPVGEGENSHLLWGDGIKKLDWKVFESFGLKSKMTMCQKNWAFSQRQNVLV